MDVVVVVHDVQQLLHQGDLLRICELLVVLGYHFDLGGYEAVALLRHGVGHGVGYISSVHEGPQSLRPQNPIVFKEGMTITDEPGVYETDEVGIRIENELECVDAGTNQYGHWLKFEPLTLVPISTEPVIVDELTRDQINWLNAYHAHVYEMLSPRLTEEEKTAAALAMTSALPDRIFTGEYDRLFGADADRTEREKNP